MIHTILPLLYGHPAGTILSNDFTEYSEDGISG